MDLSESHALTVVIGAGFVLIALLAFIGFARPQLQKLAKKHHLASSSNGTRAYRPLAICAALHGVCRISVISGIKDGFSSLHLGYVVVYPYQTDTWLSNNRRQPIDMLPLWWLLHQLYGNEFCSLFCVLWTCRNSIAHASSINRKQIRTPSVLSYVARSVLFFSFCQSASHSNY